MMKNLFSEPHVAAVRTVFADNAAVRKLFITNEGEKPLAQMEWRELADLRHDHGNGKRGAKANRQEPDKVAFLA